MCVNLKCIVCDPLYWTLPESDKFVPTWRHLCVTLCFVVVWYMCVLNALYGTHFIDRFLTILCRLIASHRWVWSRSMCVALKCIVWDPLILNIVSGLFLWGVAGRSRVLDEVTWRSNEEWAKQLHEVLFLWSPMKFSSNYYFFRKRFKFIPSSHE